MKIAEICASALAEICAKRARAMRRVYWDEAKEKALLIQKTAGKSIFRVYIQNGFRDCVVCGIDEREDSVALKMADTQSKKVFRISPEELLWCDMSAVDS